MLNICRLHSRKILGPRIDRKFNHNNSKSHQNDESRFDESSSHANPLDTPYAFLDEVRTWILPMKNEPFDNIPKRPESFNQRVKHLKKSKSCNSRDHRR